MPISTLDELLATPKAADQTAIVTIAGLGTFRVRAFSLAEHRAMRDAAHEGDTWDDARWETLVLQHGVVEPALSYDQAAQLRERPAYLVDALINEIVRLSGLGARGQVTQEAVDAAEASFRPG